MAVLARVTLLDWLATAKIFHGSDSEEGSSLTPPSNHCLKKL